MKEGAKTVWVWRNGIVVASLGTTLIFTFWIAAVNVEPLLEWARPNCAVSTWALRNETPLEDLKLDRDTALATAHDPACLARTQHLLYRRDPERFAPSPAFAEAWDRYVAMHRACSEKSNRNWTDLFLHHGQRDDASQCKHLIVVEGSGGLGNKLLSLTSAFAFALATNRVVMVDGRNKFKHLLCDPFPGSSWFLPENFPYEAVTSADGLNVAIQRNFTNITSMVTLRLDHVQTLADSQFFCDHTHSGLAKIRWLGWSSNQYYVTSMLMVPSLWAALNPLIVPGEIFTTLSHKLLLPRNRLWAHIVRILVGYLPGSSKRVGVQVRLHGRPNLGEFDPAALHRILDCLQSSEMLPELEAEESDEPELTSFAGNVGSPDISVLITSLELQYYDEMKDLYVGKANANNTVIRFHMVSHLGVQDDSVHQMEAAFVEMWLLSFSDELAISAYSTFGYVAEGIGGVKTVYLNVHGELKPNETSCFDGYSTQPCTHYPQRPHCGPDGHAKSEAHSEWMRHHVRECVDHRGGLQLVDEAPQPNPSAALWQD